MPDPRVVETDLDLPPVRRTEANFWRAECLNFMLELAYANKGLRRLKAREKGLRARLDEALFRLRGLEK